MSVRENIIAELEKNRGKYLSGQELADKLKVSRNAVSKAVMKLRDEGMDIISATNRGYMLCIQSNVLAKEAIEVFLPDFDVTVLQSVDSTNTYAKNLANNGSDKRALVVADQQTSGKGRLGKSFYSPSKSGLYMSVLLHPDIPVNKLELVTVKAAVAVAEVIDEFSDEKPQIKWVNDIFIGKKKVCGILTEAVNDFESGTCSSLIVGIGINITSEEFPDEISQIAGAVNTLKISRNKLAAEITKRFINIFDNGDPKEILSQYKKRSNLLGKEIKFLKSNVLYRATAVDINENGNLVAKLDDGSNIVLVSGEVSVKL